MENMNTFVKLASGDSEFEQAFFQLAYDKLQSKLSNLIPFLVGFQLVKKTESGTKAVGVFGFKSNNGQILFVPAFFVNGKIKDLDIMYSRNISKFYPLTEEFAELFLKDDITGLGSPSVDSKEKINRAGRGPSFNHLFRPPRTGKVSYAAVKELEETNSEAFEKAAEELLAPAEYSAHKTFLEFVKEGDAPIKQACWDLLNKHAGFVDAVRTFYSQDELAAALAMGKHAEVAEDPKLKVIDFDNMSEAKKLPPEHKSRVARDGYTIVDNRDDSEKSDAVITKFTETFSNPVKSGFYPYITEMGSIRYGLILLHPQSLQSGFSTDEALVIDLEAEVKGQSYKAKSSAVFVKDSIEVKDFSSALKNLEELAEGDPSYYDYILLNKDLHCSTPFTIVENHKDSSGIRRVKVKPSAMSKESFCDSANVVLVVTKKPGDKLDARNGIVYVPAGFKLFKIRTGGYFGDLGFSLSKAERDVQSAKHSEEAQRVRMGKPGGLYCLNGLLREQRTFPLTVHTNGSQYFLDIGGAKVRFENPVEAKIAMVSEVGLSEKTAEELLSNLVPNRKKEGYVKLAATGDYTLSMEDETPETNELGQPTYHGTPWTDTYDGSDEYTGDPTQIGLGVKQDQEQVENHVNQAVTLAQNGQKEVFDTQAIASLAKYTDTSTKVIEYIPDFITSLDKLGRMLFLAYWDTDKFEKMYGKDELPELIELVKNVFTNLGDLVIFLKRKIPDISINSNEQSLEAA